MLLAVATLPPVFSWGGHSLSLRRPSTVNVQDHSLTHSLNVQFTQWPMPSDHSLNALQPSSLGVSLSLSTPRAAIRSSPPRDDGDVDSDIAEDEHGRRERSRSSCQAQDPAGRRKGCGRQTSPARHQGLADRHQEHADRYQEPADPPPVTSGLIQSR